MKTKILSKSILIMTAILALSFYGNSYGSETGDVKNAEHKGSMEVHKGSGLEMNKEAMMAKWQKYATPAEGHTILNALVGSWSYIMKRWMSANAPGKESTGSSESAWIMDGRFVEEIVNGTSMGQPFIGNNIMGHNNGTGLYSSYWFDNMNTGSMFSEGSYDAHAKTISSSGKIFCPFRGETVYRSVLTIKNKNRHSYEMYMTEADGVEFLAMQINYTRK